MIYRAQAAVTQYEAKEVAAILKKGEMLKTAEDVIFSQTAEFSNGFYADIKLVNGDPPYVDYVLFNARGHEIAVGNTDAERIEGDYHWSVGKDKYIAKIAVTKSKSR